MRAQTTVSVLATLGFLSCHPRDFQGSSPNDVTALPAACQGDEFAVVGYNKANPSECLDLGSYRVLRWFGEDAEYQATAERFGFGPAAELIRTSGVAAAKEQYVLAANLKHEGEYWVAQIPTRKKATRIVFQISEFSLPTGPALNVLNPQVRKTLEDLAHKNEHFRKEYEKIRDGKVNAAHSQIRITYSEPILLSSHKDASKKSQIDELILSVHAVSPGSAPDSYDPVKGLKNVYGTSRGLYSVQDKTWQAIARHVQAGKEPSLVRQYQIEVPTEKIDEIVTNFVSGALGQWKNDAYNTFTTNCGSELFDILDTVMKTPMNKYWFGAKLGRYYPKFANYSLAASGVLKLKEGEKPGLFGIITDDQVAVSLPTLNKEAGLPEPAR